MKRIMWTIAAAAWLAGAAPAAAAEAGDLDRKLEAAGRVYRELLQTPDREIPERLLSDCRCVAVIPRALKGALGWGARYGQGVVSCRDDAGRWSPALFLKLTGGSFGFQIGAEASDIVLFFMTEHGARSLLESKFTLGGKVSVAAGPAGRSAEASTDLTLDAEIYSYAKAKGLFAGLSVEGARLAPDTKANATYYGRRVDPARVLFDHQVPRRPDSAASFLDALPGKPAGTAGDAR